MTAVEAVILTGIAAMGLAAAGEEEEVFEVALVLGEVVVLMDKEMLEVRMEKIIILPEDLMVNKIPLMLGLTTSK